MKLARIEDMLSRAFGMIEGTEAKYRQGLNALGHIGDKVRFDCAEMLDLTAFMAAERIKELELGYDVIVEIQNTFSRVFGTTVPEVLDLKIE